LSLRWGGFSHVSLIRKIAPHHCFGFNNEGIDRRDKLPCLDSCGSNFFLVTPFHVPHFLTASEVPVQAGTRSVLWATGCGRGHRLAGAAGQSRRPAACANGAVASTGGDVR